MGFYLRTSLRAGPFRVSLSKSGIGMSAGIPGFRVGVGPRGNYVRVGPLGVRYSATSAAKRRTRAVPVIHNPDFRPGAGVVMHEVTGKDAVALEPTGSDDLVTQLNRASGHGLMWPWVAVITGFASLLLPPFSLILLIVGPPAIIWLAMWERARRTVVAFYEVDGPAADWYEQLTGGFVTVMGLGGVWRLLSSGAVVGTHQTKVNSGASNLVNRSRVQSGLDNPPTLATNVSVPSLNCGADTLLFLPDRVLVRSGRRWSDVSYANLRLGYTPTRFIETEAVPRDAKQVGTTWQYVNVKGGPDRRFSNNRQLPIMQYGKLEITSLTGLRWIVDCSRPDVATWLAAILAGPLVVKPEPPQATQASAPVMSRPPATSAFAEPGKKGDLFAYGSRNANGSGSIHNGLYAVLDVETTGFSPATGDRIIEIAVARVDSSGKIHDEFATLVNPGRRDTGPVAVHGITHDHVKHAPRFRDIAHEIVRRLDGCVLVAHNASFEERFLAAEFTRAGITTGPIPALCTLWLGQQTFATPNHKLLTLAQHAGVAVPDAHAALGDVRAVAALLPIMLDRYRAELYYSCPPLSASALRLNVSGPAKLRTRAVGLKRGADGWMTSLLARLPMSAADAGDADAEQYLSCLSGALADGRIVGDEAHALARLAGSAGLGSAQVASLNQQFLESMREAALADNILTAAELKQLQTACNALGMHGYFDDLAVTQSPEQHKIQAAVPEQRKRCGHCRTAGHYRSRCPELVAAG